MEGADEMLQTPHRLLTSTPTRNRSEAMKKSIVWTERDGQHLGFVGGALRFSVRCLPNSEVWVLATPDRIGLFAEAGTFSSADEAKRQAEEV